MPVGAESVHQLFGARSGKMARARCERIIGSQAISGAHPRRSGHGRSVSRGTATVAREVVGRGGEVGATTHAAHAAGLRSRLLFHSNLHDGSSATPRENSNLATAARNPLQPECEALLVGSRAHCD